MEKAISGGILFLSQLRRIPLKRNSSSKGAAIITEKKAMKKENGCLREEIRY